MICTPNQVDGECMNKKTLWFSTTLNRNRNFLFCKKRLVFFHHFGQRLSKIIDQFTAFDLHVMITTGVPVTSCAKQQQLTVSLRSIVPRLTISLYTHVYVVSNMGIKAYSCMSSCVLPDNKVPIHRQRCAGFFMSKGFLWRRKDRPIAFTVTATAIHAHNTVIAIHGWSTFKNWFRYHAKP